jgi:hypothetical protein
MAKACQWVREGERCQRAALYVASWWIFGRRISKLSCRTHMVNWLLYCFERANAERFGARQLVDVQDESRAKTELARSEAA